MRHLAAGTALTFALGAVAVVACHEGESGGPCSGVDCSGFGTCFDVGSRPECTCYPGYHAVGLECLPGEADGDADSDADSGADADADGDVRGGPLLLAARAVSVAAERRCDVDGDGSMDNAVAELGADAASLFAMTMNAALAGTIEPSRHLLVHIRWVDDLAGPDADGAELAMFLARDGDWPADSADDFSGHEPMFAGAAELDEDGEPRFLGTGLHVESGEVLGGEGTFPLAFSEIPAVIRISRFGGTIAPEGATFELWLCGALRIRDAGDSTMEGVGAADLSLLELLLVGGAAFGLDAVPGLSPDLDEDGDGLEAFVSDADGRITACIDGDRTTIAGRSCWQDPRMADAFSLTFGLEGTSASWAGREPAWEYRVPAGGAPLPRQESFFSTIPQSDSPCAELDAPCDPLAVRPCCDESHRCSGANRQDYRCYAPCDPSPCMFGDLLGTCAWGGDDSHGFCNPIGPPLQPAECTPGEEGCTTTYGVSTGTECFGRSVFHCAETCSTPAAGCAVDHQCLPRAFELGGLCVLRG